MSSEDAKEGWKNPTDIMRVHRISRSRSSSSGRRSSVNSNTGKTPPQNQQPKCASKPSSDSYALKKRKNPFMREPVLSKLRKVGNGDTDSLKSLPSPISSIASFTNESVKTCPASEDEKVLEKLTANTALGVCQTEVLAERKENFQQNVLNSNDESKCILDNQKDDEWKSMDAVSQIRRCCFHYCFPCIPGLHNFPRLSSHYGNKPSPVDTTRQEVLNSLQSEWSRAFMSVYQQLRSSLCPYFYLCTHQFTALFRCVRTESRCVLSALLSPTTRGFRQLLKKEGVSFQLPRLRRGKEAKGDQDGNSTGEPIDSQTASSLRDRRSSQDRLPQEKSNSETKIDGSGDNIKRNTTVESNSGDKGSRVKNNPDGDGNDDDDEEDDEMDSPEDDAASSWLEEIGLESKHFPSLLPQNVKVQRERYQDIDNRLQSVIYMEGIEVHAFFNFLLNYPSCIATSGPQYGIPPTILSPSPFQGGTLVVNTVKQSVIQDVRSVRQSDLNSTKEPNHVLEISGPILPHHALNVTALLQDKAGSSTLSFSPHQPSTAFNTDVQSADDILLTGMRKLLVPFDSLDVGLVPGVVGALAGESCVSVKEVGVDRKGGITFTE